MPELGIDLSVAIYVEREHFEFSPLVAWLAAPILRKLEHVL
jgi:hypothetical protein